MILYGSSRAERCCRVFIIVEVDPDGRTVCEVGPALAGKAESVPRLRRRNDHGRVHRTVTGLWAYRRVTVYHVVAELAAADRLRIASTTPGGN